MSIWVNVRILKNTFAHLLNCHYLKASHVEKKSVTKCILPASFADACERNRRMRILSLILPQSKGMATTNYIKNLVYNLRNMAVNELGNSPISRNDDFSQRKFH